MALFPARIRNRSSVRRRLLSYPLSRRVFLLATLLAMVFLSSGAIAQLIPDSSFGTDGVATLDYEGRFDGIAAVLLQSDGKLLVAGTATANLPLNSNFNQAAIARYLPDGSFDPTFIHGGFSVLSFACRPSGLCALAGSVVTGLALQSDGKILVSGAGSPFLMRLLPDGAVDPSFSLDGYVDVFRPLGSDIGAVATAKYVSKPLIDGLGRTWVAVSGQMVSSTLRVTNIFRYLPDGSPDTSFGGMGVVQLAPIEGTTRLIQIALQPDGHILGVGTAGPEQDCTRGIGRDACDFAVYRFREDGTLDPSFGVFGEATFDAGGSDLLSDLYLQGDGKIVVAGQSARGEVYEDRDIVLARLLPDGTLDNTFGSGGLSRVAVGDLPVSLMFGRMIRIAAAVSLDRHPTGDFLVATGDGDIVLARFTADGQVDPVWGTGGVLAVDFGEIEVAFAVTSQPDGKIVFGGTTSPGGSFGEDWLVGRLREGEPPVADPGGPYETEEGTPVVLDAGASFDPDGTEVLFEWDLDGDGLFDDSTAVNPTFLHVVQDGVFPVSVRVSGPDSEAYAVASTTVTVLNVPPLILWPGGAPAVGPEPLFRIVSGRILDPGLEDPLTAYVDWGDGSIEPLTGTRFTGPDWARLLLDNTDHRWGDDGTFVLKLCASDDDVTVCESATMSVTNAAPQLALSAFGEPLPADAVVVVDSGSALALEARATDPGSDDLLFTWSGLGGPARASQSLVNPPLADPFPSPSVQPRDVVMTEAVELGQACLYELNVEVVDDDGGAVSQMVSIVAVGDTSSLRGLGYWKHQFKRKGRTDFDVAGLECLLRISAALSTVFDEARPASTLDAASSVLNVRSPSPVERFDRSLLVVWLNFANGALALDTLVDTTGNGVPDTTSEEVVRRAETIRMSPGATAADLDEQKDLLESIVEN